MAEVVSPLVDAILTDEERATPFDATGAYVKYGITFHDLRVEHLELLRHWRNHPDIQRFMIFREEITPEMQVKWFEGLATAVFLEVYSMLEFRGEIVGMSQLRHIDYPYHRAEGGIIIFRPEHQNGLIPYRVALAGMDSNFVQRGLETMYAQIRWSNSRARRFARSLGYEQDAVVAPADGAEPDVVRASVRVDTYFRVVKPLRAIIHADDAAT